MYDIVRVNEWTVLVGLRAMSDESSWIPSESWVITPFVQGEYQNALGSLMFSHNLQTVFPTVYLKPNIKIIGGNGGNEPYILAM